jgi:hypothetical protein
MIFNMKLWMFLASTILMSACAPHLTAVRQGLYPPREEGCKLTWVNVTPQELGLSSTWAMVGSLTFQGEGGDGGLSAEMRERAEKKACEFGGDALALAMEAVSHNAFGNGHALTLFVLKNKERASAGSPSTL